MKHCRKIIEQNIEIDHHKEAYLKSLQLRYKLHLHNSTQYSRNTILVTIWSKKWSASDLDYTSENLFLISIGNPFRGITKIYLLRNYYCSLKNYYTFMPSWHEGINAKDIYVKGRSQSQSRKWYTNYTWLFIQIILCF